MSRRSADPLRVLVSGRLAGVSGQGGATWAVLQYVLGLQRLGHEVTFVEPVCERFESDYAASVLTRFRLREASFVNGRQTVAGRPYEEVASGAFDLLVNLSGVLRDEELTRRARVRLYVDLDPAFTQLWHDHQGIDVGLAGHTHFATVGLRVGDPDCPIPSCGVDWIRTLPPVVLSEFPRRAAGSQQPWTMVGNWRSYGSIHSDGLRFGQRAHSMRGFFELPRALACPVVAALAIDRSEGDDLRGLSSGGWKLVDPVQAAGTPDRYRAFVSRSHGELCIAKEGYVVSRSGWFSDRSACYLASGRPVVAQDTGFATGLPVGAGLLAFSTVDEAAAAVERVERDYRVHATAARDLAREHLAADRVLLRLLERVGVA